MVERILESELDSRSGTPAAEAATLAYTLQRFISASAGRGHCPIKFNGSIFTVDFNGDPDYRQWGGCYWFQNTRLVYWPMLASGDFGSNAPLFRMYEDALPLARIRNKIYFNHEGCFFPETITFFGTYDNGDFGWCGRKTGKPGDPIPNKAICFHYNNTLELLAIMLDYYAYTEDKEFLRKELLPMADEFLVWWDKHWPRDAAGKLKMSPSNALETYHDVTNPAQDVAGLMWDIDRLLALSDEEIGAARRRAMEPTAQGDAGAARHDPREQAGFGAGRTPAAAAEQRGKPGTLRRLSLPHLRRRQAKSATGLEHLRDASDKMPLRLEPGRRPSGHAGIGLACPRRRRRSGGAQGRAKPLSGVLGSELRLDSGPGPRRQFAHGHAGDARSDRRRSDSCSASVAQGLGR